MILLNGNCGIGGVVMVVKKHIGIREKGFNFIKVDSVGCDGGGIAIASTSVKINTPIIL